MAEKQQGTTTSSSMNEIEELVVTAEKKAPPKKEVDFSKLDLGSQFTAPQKYDFMKTWDPENAKDNPYRSPYAAAIDVKDIANGDFGVIAMKTLKSIVARQGDGVNYDARNNHHIDAAPIYGNIPKPDGATYGITLKWQIPLRKPGGKAPQ